MDKIKTCYDYIKQPIKDKVNDKSRNDRPGA